MKNMLKFVCICTLITTIGLLAIGCEKEKKSEGKHNPLYHTAWIEYGFFHGDTIYESYAKDTFLFLTDTEMEFRAEGEKSVIPSHYTTIEDSLLYIFENQITFGTPCHYFKIIDEETLLINDWSSRDLTGCWNNIYLKKISHE